MVVFYIKDLKIKLYYFGRRENFKERNIKRDVGSFVVLLCRRFSLKLNCVFFDIGDRYIIRLIVGWYINFRKESVNCIFFRGLRNIIIEVFKEIE